MASISYSYMPWVMILDHTGLAVAPIFIRWGHSQHEYPVLSSYKWNNWGPDISKVLCTVTQSVQFSCSVVSNSLQPHESQHTRPPCPSPTPGVHSSSRPLILWCHPVISSSVVPFSSCPQSLLASESFPMSQLFAWGGQITGVSASATFLPRTPRADLLQNGLVGSPCSPRDSQESSPTPRFKSINSSALSLLHSPTLTSIHDHRKKP